jgi:hypothetical protein
MFAAFEKCLRPMENGAKWKNQKIKLERKQLNNCDFQRNEIE